MPHWPYNSSWLYSQEAMLVRVWQWQPPPNPTLKVMFCYFVFSPIFLHLTFLYIFTLNCPPLCISYVSEHRIPSNQGRNSHVPLHDSSALHKHLINHRILLFLNLFIYYPYCYSFRSCHFLPELLQLSPGLFLPVLFCFFNPLQSSLQKQPMNLLK